MFASAFNELSFTATPKGEKIPTDSETHVSVKRWKERRHRYRHPVWRLDGQRNRTAIWGAQPPMCATSPRGATYQVNSLLKSHFPTSFIRTNMGSVQCHREAAEKAKTLYSMPNPDWKAHDVRV